jgi:diacylglycerol O-acyltransferase / wax synthase
VSGFELLTAFDAQFLYWDSPNTPMNMGNICVFEAGPVLDAGGRFRLAEAQEAIGNRLHRVPRYRKKLMEIEGHHPILIDDPDFDISNHVRVLTLDPPGTEQQLKEAWARVHEGMLDRSRPLWEITFVDGLSAGRVGMVQKIHHCLFDGITTVDIMSLLFDLSPDAAPVDPAPWRPQSPPTLSEVEERRQQIEIRGALTQALYGPGVQPERLGELADATSEVLELDRPPLTSLNQPLGPRRRFDWISTTLADAKQARTLVPGATVNDVMLTVTAGGLRDLLASRGEDVDTLRLRVSIPVSLRTQPGAEDGGNLVTGFIAALPVCEPDPVEQLREIHETTSILKEGKQALGFHTMMEMAEFSSPLLMAAASRLAIQQSMFMNLTVTNVPGPPHVLYLLGAELLSIHPMVPIGNQLTVSIGVESYVDKLDIGISADYDSTYDLPVLKAGMERTLQHLLAAAARVQSPST